MQPAGGVFHVLARGVVGLPIFRDADDRKAFLSLFASVVERHGWACLAFCLMTTHYHLLVVTPNADLAQSRYGSILVERDSQFLELFRYFALNPVRGGLCDDPAAWPWGSYRIALGLLPCRPSSPSSGRSATSAPSATSPRAGCGPSSKPGSRSDGTGLERAEAPSHFRYGI